MFKRSFWADADGQPTFRGALAAYSLPGAIVLAIWLLAGGTAYGASPYDQFEIKGHKPANCFDASEYVWNIRAFASEFELVVAEFGGMVEFEGRTYIQHWELYDEGSLETTNRIIIVGEEIETGLYCIMASGVRRSF